MKAKKCTELCIAPYR